MFGDLVVVVEAFDEVDHLVSVLVVEFRDLIATAYVDGAVDDF